jgi:hypothetical protein
LLLHVKNRPKKEFFYIMHYMVLVVANAKKPYFIIREPAENINKKISHGTNCHIRDGE